MNYDWGRGYTHEKCKFTKWRKSAGAWVSECMNEKCYYFGDECIERQGADSEPCNDKAEDDRTRESSRSTCKSCGAVIVWIKTRGGKNMPCDPEPIAFKESREGGDLFVMKDGTVHRGIRYADGNAVQDELHTGYISHFANCPFADKHRRDRK